MTSGRTYRVEKIELMRRLMKGRRLCLTCLNRNRGRNQFGRARRGTC